MSKRVDPLSGSLSLAGGDESEEWPSAEDWGHSLAESNRLMPLAAVGGLRFEVTLPPQLATWLLESIARKDYLTPAEAVCIMLGEFQELTEYPELRKELLKRSVTAAMEDPSPSISAEEAFDKLQAHIKAPRPKPAVWSRRRSGDD